MHDKGIWQMFDEGAKPIFLRTDSIQGHLNFFDVGAGADPMGFCLAVDENLSRTRVEAPEMAFVISQAIAIFPIAPRGQGRCPGGQHARQIIGVNGGAPPFTRRRSLAHAGVFVPAGVEKLRMAIDTTNPYQMRQGVYQRL